MKEHETFIGVLSHFISSVLIYMACFLIGMGFTMTIMHTDQDLKEAYKQGQLSVLIEAIEN